MNNDTTILELVRFACTPFGAFGVIMHGPMMLYTLENRWLDNAPFKSCIPAGTYDLQFVRTERHGMAWWVMNVPNREGIIFHVGNRDVDTEGCILIGKSLGALGNDWALKDSAEALALFHGYMEGCARAMINITWSDNPELLDVPEAIKPQPDDKQEGLDLGESE